MIGVVGAGAFGTALAVAEAAAGRAVRLWGRDADRMAGGRGARETAALPGVPLPPALAATGELAALAEAEAILLVVPAQQTEAFLAARRGAAAAPLVLCAKGIDARDLRRQTEIAAAVLPGHPLAALTGPGFAAEIARGLPTALTLACADPELGPRAPGRRSPRRLRLYLTDDVIGAELGGALKNVIAIACGMVEGARLGASARAALMTRGFAEMTRLAVAMGARPETLAGLSGLGDLSLTCNSTQSRNFAPAGPSAPARRRPGGTVEGVATARAACQLGAATGSSCRSRPPSPTCSKAPRHRARRWTRCSRARSGRNDNALRADLRRQARRPRDPQGEPRRPPRLPQGDRRRRPRPGPSSTRPARMPARSSSSTSPTAPPPRPGPRTTPTPGPGSSRASRSARGTASIG